MENSNQPKSQFEATGDLLIRYGLVLVIGWIGVMKFTSYEAHGIQPMVAYSPLLGWMYNFLSVQTFSNLLGIVEITIAILIALRPLSPKLSAIGSAAALLMFLTTLSFLFSTPGWEPSLGGFLALSALPGQFLLKDVVLLGRQFQRSVRRQEIPVADNLPTCHRLLPFGGVKWITNDFQISLRRPRSGAKE